MKKSTEFTLDYPLKYKVVENLKIVTKVIKLTVEGRYYGEREIDVEFVWYGAEDIREILYATGKLEDIEEYCEGELRPRIKDQNFK